MLTAPNIKAPHGFFDRSGGVSEGLYKGLNCGPGSADNPAHVAENRARVSKRLSGDRETPLLTAYQIHSAQALLADHDWGENRPRGDALVCKTKGFAVGVLTADCAPVLLEDPKAGIVAAAHAGWRGALGGVVEAAIEKMVTLGAVVARLNIAVGPAIAQASYEVGEDMRNAAVTMDASAAQHFAEGARSHHYQFDLEGYLRARLGLLGAASLWTSARDTYTSPAHFSYRRTTHAQEPDYGRQVSAIMVPPTP